MRQIQRRIASFQLAGATLRQIARWVRIQDVRWWIAALALVGGVILGYGVAEWNFAHACSDAMVTATRFEDGMDPLISHPDDGAARSRLLELRTDYGRELTSCRQSFFFR